MSYIGLLGDVHGNFDALFKIMEAHPTVTQWFQVGDLGGEHDTYPTLPSNFQFIQGNHENWDYIRELKNTGNGSYLPNGTLRQYNASGDKFTVAVLGGNYSAKFFSKPTVSLQGSRIRHFTEEDYNELLEQDKGLGRHGVVDIFLTMRHPLPSISNLVT